MAVHADLAPPSFHTAVAELHSTYRSNHLQHTAPDPLVDDTVTWAMVAPHLLRALLFIVVPWFLSTVLMMIALAVDTAIAAGNLFSGSSGGGGFSALAAVIGTLMFGLGVAVLFFPIKEPIAEYAQVVEGRAQYHEPAYWCVWATAHGHGMPFQADAVRMHGVPVMLFVHERLRAMLIIRPYGDHLYVGWTMWRARSTVVLMAHFVRDALARISSGAQFRAEMRATDGRAMRELVHSLTREGVQAAISSHSMAAEMQVDPVSIHADLARLREIDPDGHARRADPFA